MRGPLLLRRFALTIGLVLELESGVNDPMAVLLLVVRGDDPIAARGTTVLQPGDHVYLFCKPQDRAFVDLLFGREEEH